MSRLKAVVLGVAFMALPAIARAQTITFNFDDVPACTDGTLLPDPYHGFNWHNFYVVKGSDPYCMVASGYRDGVKSSPNVAFNGNGDPASFSNANSFTFNSVYMTAAWNDGLKVLVQGYVGGNPFYSSSFVLDPYIETRFDFNWVGVDKVLFTSSDGIHDPAYNFYGEEIAFDNLTVSDVTPEPSTLLLLGTGLTGIGAVIRRRRQKNIER